MKRLWTWLASRKLEISIFLLGVLLRCSMGWNYPFWGSYDSDAHWEVVNWIAKHGRVPYPEAVFEAFHPPLYYSFAAWLHNLGVSRPAMAWVSISAGVLELGVVWAGLELFVTHSRLARICGLALAATVSASVHLSGMVYPESFNCLWSGVAMLLTPLAFRREGGARWPLTLLLGFVLGLGMLTKISTAVIVATIGLGVILEFALSPRSISGRLHNMVPWAGTLAVALAVCGWYFARNVYEYGRPFVTSFDLPSQHWLVKDAAEKPLLDRRTLGFVFGWDNSLYGAPFRTSPDGPAPRLFPVAIASTFDDFWGYSYQGYKEPFQFKRTNETRREQFETLDSARGAWVGGEIAFIATLLAWFAATRRLFRDRDIGRLTLVLVPLADLVATWHFATAYPIDTYGVVKGIYMTFGAPPLYALFGIAIGWAARRRERLPVFALLVVSLWMIAEYSLDCRLGIKLPPA